jgi:hypothetical protein
MKVKTVKDPVFPVKLRKLFQKLKFWNSLFGVFYAAEAAFKGGKAPAADAQGIAAEIPQARRQADACRRAEELERKARFPYLCAQRKDKEMRPKGEANFAMHPVRRACLGEALMDTIKP